MTPDPSLNASVTVLDDSGDCRIERLPDGARVLRLTRPAKLNAITKAILVALTRCLDEMERDRARLLVIVGEGAKAFCAGTDLAETQAMPLDARQAKSVMARDLLVRLSRSPVLSVAAVNGLAFGGGLELAMACTLRVAAAHATVSLPEIKLGLLPAYAGTQFLPALVGPSRALDIMLTGRVVDAQPSRALGLSDRPQQQAGVVPERMFCRDVGRAYRQVVGVDPVGHAQAPAGWRRRDLEPVLADLAARQGSARTRVAGLDRA